MTQVADSSTSSTWSFTYDNMNRLTQTTSKYGFMSGRNTFTVKYGYDAASNRTSLTDPENGFTQYTYDTLNRLTNLQDFQSHNFGFSYDQLSRRTQLTRPNGVSTNYTYDNLSRLLSVLHQTGSATLDGASYTYDAAGNRNSKTDYLAGVTTNYAYDAVYQLLQATQGSTTTESYTYDAVGNRLSSLGMSPYQYNSSNELTSTPTTTYTYDKDGELNTKVDSTGTTTYNWNTLNQLTSVVLPGSAGTVSFKYDPFGRRIQKSTASATTNYLYDGPTLVEEVDQNGNPLARYSQSSNVDEPLEELRSSTTSYYDADGTGSLTAISTQTGALANTYTYDSFGKATGSTGSIVNSFRYTGREFDSDTGIYFYRARYYDQNVGRFLTEDPAGFDGGRSFYSYTRNNPALLTDPSGFTPEQKCDCQGNSGGWRVAGKCCQRTVPMPSSTRPNPYGPCDSFAYINAAYIYANGGDNAWGQIVRSCLLCAYHYGTSAGEAHALCFAIAADRVDHWWNIGIPSTYGFAVAVAAAAHSGVLQTIQYIRNHGNKPLTCLDGVQ
jgi:RHS repeat-associated protein